MPETAPLLASVQRVASVADAMNLCEAWKAAYRLLGWNEPPE